MSKTIKIIQNLLSEHDVSADVINKLYNMIYRKETFNENTLDFDTSSFIGEIYLTGPTYQEYIDKINEYFKNLKIHPTSIYIKFEDSVVEQILLNAGIGDGIGITYTAAAAVKSLPSFKSNTDITSFNELKYFTSIKTLEYQAFQQCTNLISIDLSNITKLESNVFAWCSLLEHIIDGSKITYIGSKAFCECKKLIDVNIQWETVTYVSWDDAFSQVPITGDIKLINVVGEAPEPAFIKTEIRSITYGPGIYGTSGGRVMNLGWANYISSPNLIFVDLSHSNITKMKEYGYNNCNTMKLIKLPSSLTKFGNFVFNGCTALEAIVLYATTPPAYDGETYNNMDITTPMLFDINTTSGATREYSPPNASVRLYVPKSSLTAYKTDSVWGKYADIMLTIEDDYTDPSYYTQIFT